MRHCEIIKKIAKTTGTTPKLRDLAQILNKPVGTINSRASRDLSYSYDEILKIEKYYGIHFTDSNLEQIKNDILTKRLDYLEQKDDFSADYYPDVFGSCGGGTFVFSEIKEKIQIPKRIVQNYSSIKKYFVINAIGDSMNPYINDGDLLVVEHYNGEQIRDNRVYVFRFGENIFVKRLVLNINQLIIKSDNTEYAPINIELNENTDIQIIGQIVGLMRGVK